jgi:hypothetical protein
MRIGFLPTVVAGTLLAVAPRVAQSQMLFNQIGNTGKPAPPAPKVAPPPALPGAASSGNAAPSNRGPSDMEPNEALFDAINRGDVGAARDAISRGADLRGLNVLGMTPLELSVDLGRNDISFMLLSMRGGDSGAPPTNTATKPPPAKQAKRNTARPAVPAAKAAASAQAAPAQTARLFSGDGGAPIPNAGFLGFDSGRR